MTDFDGPLRMLLKNGRNGTYSRDHARPRYDRCHRYADLHQTVAYRKLFAENASWE